MASASTGGEASGPGACGTEASVPSASIPASPTDPDSAPPQPASKTTTSIQARASNVCVFMVHEKTHHRPGSGHPRFVVWVSPGLWRGSRAHALVLRFGAAGSPAGGCGGSGLAPPMPAVGEVPGRNGAAPKARRSEAHAEPGELNVNPVRLMLNLVTRDDAPPTRCLGARAFGKWVPSSARCCDRGWCRRRAPSSPPRHPWRETR